MKDCEQYNREKADGFSLLHRLPRVEAPRPVAFTNPFSYRPDAYALAASQQLVEVLEGRAVEGWKPLSQQFLSEAARGKMFGVLVVSAPSCADELFFLAAFSGQMEGKLTAPGFVPPVFGYLQVDGYFMQGMERMAQVARTGEEKQWMERIAERKERLRTLQMEAAADIDEFAAEVKRKKQQRNAIRKALTFQGEKDTVKEQEMIRESQYMKARLHSLRKQWNEKMDALTESIHQDEASLADFRARRKQESEALQDWLFRQHVVHNAEGQTRDLPTIFRDYAARKALQTTVPPSGAGECCEPRLLETAFRLSLQPLSMAMFWWGESPRDVVRKQGQYYPACSRKCKPILDWMLRGLKIADSIAQERHDEALKVIYEDEHLAVVDKPSGMLSVPGRTGEVSVEQLMRERWNITDERPIIVHRLDMDTSGLMIVARTEAAYHVLQDEFLHHKVKKRYEALLVRPISSTEGFVRLPLSADIDDRPRQKVDHENGKPSVTRYKRIAENRISLWPETGRTHQLRVHCAHCEGLDNPIKGDRLYYKEGEGRLCLHAADIVFFHPSDGRRMRFSSVVPF